VRSGALVCALDREGVVLCADDAQDDGPALRVDTRGPVRAMAADTDRLVFLHRDGTVGCVGDCQVPGLVSDPAMAAMFQGATGVAAGGGQVCTLDGDGVARCFGPMWVWRPPTRAGSAAGEARERAGVFRVDAPAAVVSMHLGTAPCLVFGDETAGCQATPTEAGLARVSAMDSLRGIRSVVSTGRARCVLFGDGRVQCRGENRYGQLGDGTTTDRADFAPVTGLDDVVDLVAGEGYACALRGDETVWCWGLAASGQLGREGTAGVSCRSVMSAVSCSPMPAPVPGLRAVRALVAAGDAVCALGDDDAVRCWGAGRGLHRVSFERTPVACVSAGLRAEGRIARAYTAATERGVRYCLCGIGSTLLGEQCRCLHADLTAGTLEAASPVMTEGAFVPPPPESAPTVDAAGPFGVTVVAEGFRVCPVGQGEGCRVVRAPREGRVGAPQVTEAGDFVLSVLRTAGTSDDDGVDVLESYAVATGRRVARVGVRSGFGAAFGSVQVTGRVAVIQQCAAGPSCNGTLVDIATGRVLPRLPVQFYGAQPVRLGPDRWVWWDATHGQALYVNARGQAQGPALTWPVQGSVEGELMDLPRGDTRVVVYDGDGSPTGHGGTVVQVDLAARRVVRTLVPAVCEGASAP